MTTRGTSAILVSPGFALKTGYYQRAIRDGAALEANGFPPTYMQCGAFVRALTRLRLGEAWRWLKTVRAAEVVVSENYGSLLFHMLLNSPSPLRRQQHVFVAHGSLAELDEYRFGGLKRMLYRWAERSMVPRMNLVACVSQVMVRDFRAAYPKSSAHIRWSPNNPQPAFYEALEAAAAVGPSQLRLELDLPPEGRLLMYVGNMQAWQNVDLLIAVAREAAGLSDRSHLVCLTGDPEAFSAALRDAGVPEERYTVRRVPNIEVPRYLACADWLFVVRERSEINRVACPTKAVEYLLSGGRLIVSQDLGDFTAIVQESGRGMVVDEALASDPAALARALLETVPDEEAEDRGTPPLEYGADHTVRLFAEFVAGDHAT